MQEAKNAMVGAIAARDFSPVANRATPTLQEVADAYMANYRGRSKPVGTLAMWTRELGHIRVSELTADQICDVLQRYAAEPVTKYIRTTGASEPTLRMHGRRAPATINRVRAVLAGVLTYARKKRLVPRGWTNPMSEVFPEEFNNERTRFLSPEERNRLFAAARVSTYPRLLLLILMAVTTGARKGELLALRYADLNLDAGTAHVRTSKNGEQRVLPLVPTVIAEIKRFGKAQPEALLFGSIKRPGNPMEVKRAFDNAVRAAQVEDFRFHDLRHSCASYLAQNGATLLEIADVLGHKTLDMVRRYSHLTVGHKAALVNRVLGNIAGAA